MPPQAIVKAIRAFPPHFNVYDTSPENCCGLTNYHDFFIDADPNDPNAVDLHAWHFSASPRSNADREGSCSSKGVIVVVHGHGSNMAQEIGTDKSVLGRSSPCRRLR